MRKNWPKHLYSVVDLEIDVLNGGAYRSTPHPPRGCRSTRDISCTACVNSTVFFIYILCARCTPTIFSTAHAALNHFPIDMAAPHARHFRTDRNVLSLFDIQCHVVYQGNLTAAAVATVELRCHLRLADAIRSPMLKYTRSFNSADQKQFFTPENPLLGLETSYRGRFLSFHSALRRMI